MRFTRLLLTIGCLFIAQWIHGQSLAVEDYINQSKLLNNSTKIIASDSIITPENAYELLQGQIEIGGFNPVTPGYSNNYYWILFDLKTKTKEDVLLEIANAHIDSVAIYHYKDGMLNKLFECGDHFPFKSRPYLSRNFVFPLNLTSTSNIFLLSVIKKSSSLNMPMFLWEKNHFSIHDKKRTILYWVFFGVIGAFIISSFIIYFNIKDVSFALFGIYALFTGLYIFGNHGFAAQYLLSDFPQLNDYYRPTIAWVISISGILFFNSFLKIREQNPKISYLLKIIVIVLIGLFVVAYYDFDWTRNHGIFILNSLFCCMVCAIILIIWAALKAYKKERFRVLTFFISSFLAFIGTLIFLFMSYGFVDPLSIDTISVGLGSELLGFGIALVATIHIKQTSESLSVDIQSSKLDIMLGSLEPEEIEYIKSHDHHCHIHCIDESFNRTIRSSIQSLAGILPSNYFVQVHRSFIVNARHIKVKYSNKLIMNSGEEIPISRSMKNTLDNFLSDSNNE